MGYLDQTPLYNAANFMLAPGPTGGELGSAQNPTVYNTTINSFLCPSDPNANYQRNNSYHMSFGSTTYTDPIHTSGMFAVWTSYGIRDCTDGTSNTIAFAEALCSQDATINPASAEATLYGPSPYRGNVIMANGPPDTTTNQGADDPLHYFVGGVQYLYASSASAAVLAGLQACAVAWNSPNAVCEALRGWRWADANGGWAWTNIITTPNRDAIFPGGGCRWGMYPDGIDSAFVYGVSSNHPGGANILFADGHVQFVKDSVARFTWWALGTRNGGEVISSDSY